MKAGVIRDSGGLCVQCMGFNNQKMVLAYNSRMSNDGSN